MLKESKSYFENFAGQWVEDAYSKANKELPIGEQRKQLVLKIINKISNDSLNILDIGSGGGQITKALLAQGHKVTAVDRSVQMLTLLENECANLNSSQQLNLKTIHSCATTLEEKIVNNQYDVILCIGMIYYLEDENVIYKIIKNNLQPQGTAIVTFRNKLFNLFPNSRHQISNPQEMYQLYQETNAINKQLSNQAFQNFLIAMKEQINQAITHLQKAETVESQHSIENNQLKNVELESQKVLGRQHTPEQVIKTLNQFQLNAHQFYGIQPHFILANNQNTAINQCLQLLSMPLWTLSNAPISLSWSSHFLVELKHS